MKTTKKQICDAAMELFKENGYENVSIQDICNVCGVTRGSFYHHYKSKDDLLIYWELCHAEGMIGEIRQDTDMDAVEYLLKYQMDYAADISSIGCDLLYHLILAMVNTGDNIIGSHKGIGVYIGSEPVVELIRKATDTDLDTAHNLLRYYNMAVTGLVVEWKLSNGDFDFVAECRAISEAVFHLK